MENYFCANSVEEQVDYLTDKVKDIITNKLDKASIVQETGTGTDVVMSQKAVTDAIANKGLDTLTNVNLTVGNTTVQYDNTNGIQLNSTARFTDGSGNHDATMELDIPIVGKDGIVIEKAADSEKIEISGKNFVKKTSSTEGSLIYTNVNGTDSTIGLSAGNEVGKVAQYYDEHQWPGDNSQGGFLVTATPTKPYHGANKKYVDDSIASISPTTQTKYQHNLVLEGTKLGSTFKAFMSIPRSDNTAFGTLDEVIAALGDAYISCTGYIYDGNQKSYNIVAFNTAGPGFEYNDPESGGQVFVIGNDDVAITDTPKEF